MFAPDGRAVFCQPDCQAAYERLYNIESYLRHMLRWELVGKFAENWTQPIDERLKEAEERRKHEGNFRVIDADERNLMSYLMLTDIRDTMMEDAVWPLFKDDWPPLEHFKNTFQLLIALRNKNAHYRAVTARDLRTLDRIEDNLIDFTARYGRDRRTIRNVEPDKLPAPFKDPVANWTQSITPDAGVWDSLKFGRVGPYLVVTARAREGSLPSDSIDLLLKAKTDCFFAGFEATSGRLDLYLPITIGPKQAERIIAAARSLQTEDVEIAEGLADEAPRLDYVFPIEVQLPVGFRP